ncbi:AMP-binding protein [Rhizobium leguminosarum]|uniref:AMP-binding protein n=1 Tax=Rhizobium leguminosarum TaxID=384 RepID=UPI0024A95B81|nr:AMP-binding protein [Rhizobium leguminosarum]MDI5929682.1 AMP-binding protein [Rhizobium leguminosarum]
MTTLYGLVENAPSHATCLRFGGSDVTYGDLRERVQRVAGGLQNNGLRRGDTVAVWLPNVAEWLVIVLACARSGLQVLSINLRMGPNEIGDFVARTGSKAIIYCEAHAGKNNGALLASIEHSQLSSLRLAITLDHVPSVLPHVASIDYDSLLQGSLGADLAASQDPCVVFSSSGTTSRPKLIQHSQERVVRQVRAIARTLHLLEPDAKVYAGVPFCGAFGFTAAFSALAGHCSISLDETFDAERVIDTLDTHEITNMFGTNDMLERMLDVAGRSWTPRTLRTFSHANFTPGLDALPGRAEQQGVKLRGCFGMSETLALFAAQPQDAALDRRAESGGVPTCPLARVRVRDVSTGELLGIDAEGELEIHTPNLMLGYLGDQEATVRSITSDGFFKTGDVARLTEDGGFTHVSRIGDVIRVAGFLVNPLEIEDAAVKFPNLSACQVVEVTTPQGSRPVAFVIGRAGYVHDEAALIAHCKARLAIFKVPVRFFEVTEFPVTSGPNGTKVRKNELREEAQIRIAQKWRDETSEPTTLDRTLGG